MVRFLKESNEETNKRIYTIRMKDGRKVYTDRDNVINYYDFYDSTPYKNMIWATNDLDNIVDGKLRYGFTVFTSEIEKIPPRSQVESDDWYGDESPQNYDVDESLKESGESYESNPYNVYVVTDFKTSRILGIYDRKSDADKRIKQNREEGNGSVISVATYFPSK